MKGHQHYPYFAMKDRAILFIPSQYYTARKKQYYIIYHLQNDKQTPIYLNIKALPAFRAVVNLMGSHQRCCQSQGTSCKGCTTLFNIVGSATYLAKIRKG